MISNRSYKRFLCAVAAASAMLLCFTGCIPLRESIPEIKFRAEKSQAADPGYSQEGSPDYQEPSLRVGSIYTMGHYPQSGSNDPIEWIVLNSSDGRALLLSRFALDSVSFHGKKEKVTWENSSIRQWLNGVFYRAAFSDAEKECILNIVCSPESNSLYNVDGGNATYDNVFLLSAGEAAYYMPGDGDRLCQPTSYAIKQGAYLNQNTGGSWWWLRTPGSSQMDACSVNSDGSLDMDDGTVNSLKGTVRPAIWIDIP